MFFARDLLNQVSKFGKMICRLEQFVTDVLARKRRPFVGETITICAGARVQVCKCIAEVPYNRRHMPQQFRGGEAEKIGFRIG